MIFLLFIPEGIAVRRSSWLIALVRSVSYFNGFFAEIFKAINSVKHFESL